MKREILHMSLSQREVPAAAGWPSRWCVPGALPSLGACGAASSILMRFLGLLALLAAAGRRRAGRDDWDLLVAVIASADLTPA